MPDSDEERDLNHHHLYFQRHCTDGKRTSGGFPGILVLRQVSYRLYSRGAVVFYSIQYPMYPTSLPVTYFLSKKIQNITKSHKRKMNNKMLPIRDNSSCASVSIPVNLFASLDSLQQQASGDTSMGLSTFSPLLTIDARLFRVNDTEEQERTTEETRRGPSPKEKNLLHLDVVKAALAALKDDQ